MDTKGRAPVRDALLALTSIPAAERARFRERLTAAARTSTTPDELLRLLRRDYLRDIADPEHVSPAVWNVGMAVLSATRGRAAVKLAQAVQSGARP
jgi:hypothetical protein